MPIDGLSLPIPQQIISISFTSLFIKIKNCYINNHVKIKLVIDSKRAIMKLLFFFNNIFLAAFFLLALLLCGMVACTDSPGNQTKGQEVELCYGGSVLLPQGWSMVDCESIRLSIFRDRANRLAELAKSMMFYEVNGQEQARIQLICTQYPYSRINAIKSELISNPLAAQNYMNIFKQTSKEEYEIKDYAYNLSDIDGKTVLATSYEAVSLPQTSEQTVARGCRQ